jgi:hypothetical protein
MQTGFRQLSLTLVSVLFAAIALAPSPASALLSIRVDGVLVATDNGAGDANATLGVVVVSTSTSEFNVLVEVGQSKPVLAGSAITLSTTYTASGVAGSAFIEISDTGFTSPSGFVTLFASEGGNLGAGVQQQFTAIMNSNNTLFCGAGTSVNLNTVTGTNGNSKTKDGTVTSPYCLTGALTLTSAGGNAGTGGSSDTGLRTISVPEPASMLLFGLGLAGLGIWGRKRLN